MPEHLVQPATCRRPRRQPSNASHVKCADIGLSNLRKFSFCAKLPMPLISRFRHSSQKLAMSLWSGRRRSCRSISGGWLPVPWQPPSASTPARARTCLSASELSWMRMPHREPVCSIDDCNNPRRNDADPSIASNSRTSAVSNSDPSNGMIASVLILFRSATERRQAKLRKTRNLLKSGPEHS